MQVLSLKRKLSIYNKLWLLGILNITDILFTYILVNAGVCYEANKIMLDVLQDTVDCFSLKIAIPSLLLVYLYFRLKGANPKQIKISNNLINIALVLYLFINISHCFCTIFLL